MSRRLLNMEDDGEDNCDTAGTANKPAAPRPSSSATFRITRPHRREPVVPDRRSNRSAAPRRRTNELNGQELDDALHELELDDRRDASPVRRTLQPTEAQVEETDNEEEEEAVEEGNEEDNVDEMNMEGDALVDIESVLHSRAARPAAAGAAPVRHTWTKIEDSYLILGVLEVGVGNWPRVLHTIHARWHQLTWANVCCLFDMYTLTNMSIGPCSTAPSLDTSSRSKELA